MSKPRQRRFESAGRVCRLARAEPGKTRQRRFDLHKTLKNNETGWSKYENTDIKK